MIVPHQVSNCLPLNCFSFFVTIFGRLRHFLVAVVVVVVVAAAANVAVVAVVVGDLPVSPGIWSIHLDISAQAIYFDTLAEGIII